MFKKEDINSDVAHAADNTGPSLTERTSAAENFKTDVEESVDDNGTPLLADKQTVNVEIEVIMKCISCFKHNIF